MEKSNSQKKITIIEKKREEYLDKLLQSPWGQPILSFVDKVILRYHVSTLPDISLNLFEGNKELYDKFLGYLTSDELVAMI
jgi:hypothetical protein